MPNGPSILKHAISTGSSGGHELEIVRVSDTGREARIDTVVDEVPVALVYNGKPFAVMLATPRDLADFALGFSLTEGIIASVDEFELVDILRTAAGITLQVLIPHPRFEAVQQRRRNLAGRGGCGLCGMELLEEAVRPTPKVTSSLCMDRATIVHGMQQLAATQPLNAITGGAHAAAMIGMEADSSMVREDVGRHNALDKLIGALRSQRRVHAADGFVAITSRASWEIVHKAAWSGTAILAAISAPTALAIKAADAAGITLIAFARDEAMNVYSHPHRIR